MKQLLPRVDGKIVLDVSRDEVSGIFEFGTVAHFYQESYKAAKSIAAESFAHGIVQDYSPILKATREWKAINPFDIEGEAIILKGAAEGISHTGNNSVALTLLRGVGATIRLSWYRKPSTIQSVKLSMSYQSLIRPILYEKIYRNYKKKAERPWFTVKEINLFEEEFGIGHCSEKNYKCNGCGIGCDDKVKSLNKCSGCNRVWYCGEDCNVQAWSQHKLNCKSKWRTKPLVFQSYSAAGYGQFIVRDPVTHELFDSWPDCPVESLLESDANYKME